MRLQNPAYPSDRLYTSATRILTANTLCSMATHSEQGEPHINTAFFCFSEDLDLYFLSDPAAIHSRNVSHSTHMAVAVFDTHQRWGAAHKGLQLFGDCTLAQGAAEPDARALYSSRFPYAEFLDRLSREKRTAFSTRLRFYGFRPAAIKILDEDEFGEEVFVDAEVLR